MGPKPFWAGNSLSGEAPTSCSVGAIEKKASTSVRIATVTFIKLVIFVYYHFVEPTGIKKGNKGKHPSKTGEVNTNLTDFDRRDWSLKLTT